jgi:hypothetical protein
MGASTVPEQLCAYVADISAELHRLARGCELTVLACLLNLVNAEAERQARERRKLVSRCAEAVEASR